MNENAKANVTTYLVHATSFEDLGSNLHHIQRVIVALEAQLRMQNIRILPGLREGSVVPEDRTVVVSELALFNILRNRVGLFLGGDFKLGSGVLGDFVDKVEMFAVSQWDVVPRRYSLSIFSKLDTKLRCSCFSNRGAGRGKAPGNELAARKRR